MNRNEKSLNAIFNNRAVKSSVDKETIKKEIENEFWDVLNFVDPMDHYTGVDTSVERMESWEEEVAKRYGVDPLVINEITQEITRDAMDKAVKEEEWARKNLNDDEFDKWMLGELDISDRINSSKKSIKSSVSEYRDKNGNVIVKADGDSSTRTIIEIVDDSCDLKVGDSVNDFSGLNDYLDDVYHGKWIVVSSRRMTSANKK